MISHIARNDWLSRKGLWLLAAILASFACSLALWDPLDIDERVHVQRITEESVRSIKADIIADMEARFLAQKGLADLLAVNPGLSEAERKLATRLFLDHHPGYIALQWLDAKGHRRWSAIARPGYEPEIKNAHIRDRMLESASVSNNQVVMSRTFHLSDQRVAAWVIVPVTMKSNSKEFLAALVDLRAVLQNILEDHSGLGYSVAVLEDDELIYRTPGTSATYENEWARDGSVQIPGVTWHIRVWPNPNILSEIRSSLPEFALFLGAVLGFLLILTVYFARAERAKSRELREAHDELESRVASRTIELQRSNEALQSEIAERKRTEDSLRYLSGRLLQLQDDERRHMARELHDSTAQLLGALNLEIAKAEKLLRSADPELLDALRDSKKLVDRVTSEIRTVSYLLHPPILDDLGLEYVLPWYAEGFSKRSGIQVNLQVTSDLGRLPHEVEVALFRITQESLANVHRHSGSTTARISLTKDDEFVSLEISDRGCGIPAGFVNGTTVSIASLGVGIAGMRERIRQLGGTLTISGSPSGTIVSTLLPIRRGTAGHSTTMTVALTAQQEQIQI
jgi:signal transduction histidine kinase